MGDAVAVAVTMGSIIVCRGGPSGDRMCLLATMEMGEIKLAVRVDQRRRPETGGFFLLSLNFQRAERARRCPRLLAAYGKRMAGVPGHSTSPLNYMQLSP